ncbi:putative quinol monooxygenase [Streptomyces sp. NPDC021098]|uniref:putative quinol monooxygenase n=1 Tax=unclassified Streptomyces TaxID=2593676 RepID=UPI0037A6780D
MAITYLRGRPFPMSITPVHVVARFRAREGSEEETARTLAEFVAPSLSHTGCLYYELQQNNADPRDFVILDGWESSEALAAHAGSEHVAATSKKLDALLAGPAEIVVYHRLS